MPSDRMYRVWVSALLVELEESTPIPFASPQLRFVACSKRLAPRWLPTLLPCGMASEFVVLGSTALQAAIKHEPDGNPGSATTARRLTGNWTSKFGMTLQTTI